MRKIFIPLLAAIALPKYVNANVAPEVHNLCKDVSDYVGCVKANSSNKNWNIFNKKNISEDYKELNIFVGIILINMSNNESGFDNFEISNGSIVALI